MPNPLIEFSIDRAKIDKSLLPEKKPGAKSGPYMNCAMFESRNDEYDQDGFIVQSTTKAQREAGLKGPIIGNWKYVDAPNKQPGTAPKHAPKPQAKPPVDPDLDAEDDDIPF